MKLAQALNLRKKHKTDFVTLLNLLCATAVVFPGDEPPEKEPGALLDALLGMVKTQADLIHSINGTNQMVRLPNRMLLGHAIVLRDHIKGARDHLDVLLKLQRERKTYEEDPHGGRRSVLQAGKMALDLSKVRRVLDDLSRQWRELDDLIQQTNWTVDVSPVD